MIRHVFVISISLNYQKTPIRTSSNKYKLTQHRCYYNLRKYIYTNRVIPIWNRLSDSIVSAKTVNTFKRHLDKFWSGQDVLHNYKPDLHGIKNRSAIV